MKVSDLMDTATTTPTSSVPAPPRRWMTRVVVPAAVVLATIALLLGSLWTTLFPGRSVDVVPVVVKNVEAGVGPGGITASGWLEPDPYPTYVSALAGGVVEEVLVLEGESLEAGAAVARLVADDAELALAHAEAELAMKKAELERARADRDAAQEVLESLVDRRESKRVTEARVRECDAALAQAEEEIAAADAAVAALEDELVRKEKLVESGAVSEGALRRLSLRADAARAQRAATVQRRAVLETQREQAQAKVDAAKEHLELTIEERHALARAEASVRAGEAGIARATARRDEARLRLQRMTVRAPVAGVVLRRLAVPGSAIMVGGEGHGAHVVHLYDPKRLQVRVDVPLADAAGVGVDQIAEVSIEAVPDQRFRGRVTRLVHEADIQKNTVEVKVAIDDPNVVLKPEMLARVQFKGRNDRVESRRRVLAPERCLHRVGGSTHVWVVTDRVASRGIATRRAVELGGAQHEGWLEIVQGLQPGDWLIADAPSDLREGERVVFEGEGS